MIKEIDFTSALKRIAEGSNQVCMLVPMSVDTILSVEELIAVKGFALVTDQGNNNKKGEDPEQKPKQKKPGKPAIDRGKIGALHRAGWSTRQIASEVGCSDQTVLNVIKELEANNDGDNSKD